MFAETGSNSPTLVTAIFCEPFSVASAIAGLLQSGFADHDIHAVGVLEGHAPAVSEFLPRTKKSGLLREERNEESGSA